MFPDILRLKKNDFTKMAVFEISYPSLLLSHINGLCEFTGSQARGNSNTHTVLLEQLGNYT